MKYQDIQKGISSSNPLIYTIIKNLPKNDVYLHLNRYVSSIQIQIQKVIKTHLFSLHNN